MFHTDLALLKLQLCESLLVYFEYIFHLTIQFSWCLTKKTLMISIKISFTIILTGLSLCQIFDGLIDRLANRPTQGGYSYALPSFKKNKQTWPHYFSVCLTICLIVILCLKKFYNRIYMSFILNQKNLIFISFSFKS